MNKYNKWLNSEEAKRWLLEREEREKEIAELLSLDNFDKFSELDFRKIVSSLWAYAGFTNKDYVADKILEKTSFDALKSELKNLLYGTEPFAKRYDRFFEKVKGIGPAGVTEILAFVKKDQFGIWNEKSRKALKTLGFESVLPVNKWKLSGSEYELVNDSLKSISKIIKDGEVDLLFVDLFLFNVSKYLSGENGAEDEDYDFDHDEIIDKLVEIGEGLGFKAESNKDIAKGARVDVIWQAKIANLGVLNYVFEVQKQGSVDSLILNLQRAKNNQTVQKLIIVANRKQLDEIKEEVASLSEDFKKSLTYLEVKDVEKASELWRELSLILNKLELVKSF
ncbi:MAG: hypothetical protein QXP32_08710 [Nitrososphaeria archaeon]